MAGQLDEAEKTARRAITIDPSDGEQGEGRRMMVYTVLADILEKRGNPADRQQVATYRRAVKAIRMAEEADDLAEVGLQHRAIKQYQVALDLFADAYCIQSRLAVKLASSGQIDEAAKHFERAFELMPISFGRMESHCFGCEGIFEGKLAQSIAERTLTTFAGKHPDNPRVFYLLGRLHQEEQQPAAALSNFREAVRLDADYMNAWRQIAELVHEMTPPGDEEAELEVLRLGPADDSVREIDAIHDVSRLWSAVAAELSRAPQPVDKLWPLPASAKLLDIGERQSSVEVRVQWLLKHRSNRDQDVSRWPGTFIFKHSAIMQKLAELVK
jgi:tetratricopeptide (TPR) repeat protein